MKFENLSVSQRLYISYMFDYIRAKVAEEGLAVDLAPTGIEIHGDPPGNFAIGVKYRVAETERTGHFLFVVHGLKMRENGPEGRFGISTGRPIGCGITHSSFASAIADENGCEISCEIPVCAYDYQYSGCSKGCVGDVAERIVRFKGNLVTLNTPEAIDAFHDDLESVMTEELLSYLGELHSQASLQESFKKSIFDRLLDYTGNEMKDCDFCEVEECGDCLGDVLSFCEFVHETMEPVDIFKALHYRCPDVCEKYKARLTPRAALTVARRCVDDRKGSYPQEQPWKMTILDGPDIDVPEMTFAD